MLSSAFPISVFLHHQHRFCHDCERYLGLLPLAARFCPRCGGELPRRMKLHTSRIAAGYARAMYKLGRTYHATGGSSANLHEAARCYYKSFRLGNFDALMELASIEAEMEHQPPRPVLPLGCG